MLLFVSYISCESQYQIQTLVILIITQVQIIYKMSLGNQNLQASLEQQIDRRISHESPTKYDLDFYLRKICRLENDLNQVQDQLSRARVRLRRAEDFEIKYQLLMKQNSNLLNDLDKIQKDNFALRSHQQIMKNQLQDRHEKVQDFSTQKQNLHKQIQKWKAKYEQSAQLQRSQNTKYEEKLEKKIKQEVESIKRQFIEKEDHYQQQIRQYRKTLHQKETIQNVVSGKVQKVRIQKDEQIKRISKILENKKLQSAQTLKQKNEEIDKLRQKFEKVFNFEIQNLRKTLDDQDELFSIQNNGLRELLELKNNEINKLIGQLKKQTQNHEKQREQISKQCSALRQKIYSIQRQNELQLYNVKERLTKIHALQIQTIQKRYTDLVNNLKTERTQLEKLLKQKDKLIQAQKKDAERVKQELYQRLKERDARIKLLEARIKQMGEINQSQMKNLHHSFHEIETDKQNQASQYEKNIGFLNQQLAKLTGINQLKNKEIKELYEEIANMKKVHGQVVRDLEERWKQQRRERQQQRQRQRDKRQKILEQQRQKQKQWRHRQRQLERERQKQEREKNKMKYINQQLQKDVERLNQYNKQLDESLKRQLKKNQVSTLDAGGIRRQLTSELEKQKNQCQAIKRMEIDQIKQKYQVQMTRLTNQNERLQTTLLNKQLAYQELSGEFKKLQHINKNIQRINKDKLAEYQRRMATLNNEVNLTQNLYKSFMECKARKQDSP